MSEVNVIREMVRADLELAFDHLNNDNPQLCAHELRNALEKVAQISELLSGLKPESEENQPTLLLEDHDETEPRA